MFDMVGIERIIIDGNVMDKRNYVLCKSHYQGDRFSQLDPTPNRLDLTKPKKWGSEEPPPCNINFPVRFRRNPEVYFPRAVWLPRGTRSA